MRIRDYTNFARLAGFLVEGNQPDTLRTFDQVPPLGEQLNDEYWTNLTSLQALEFLQQPLNVSGGAYRARDKLKATLEAIVKQQREPTVAAIAESVGVTGNRNEEMFRWALLIHIDGVNSQFGLRFSPRVHWKDLEG